MGIGRSKKVILEPYTSFDAFPTEYIQRKRFQQQQQQQQQSSRGPIPKQQPVAFIPQPAPITYLPVMQQPIIQQPVLHQPVRYHYHRHHRSVRPRPFLPVPYGPVSPVSPVYSRPKAVYPTRSF